MNLGMLQDIGMTPAQAKIYMLLIQKGRLTPPQVATMSNETRTNAYMVLEKLEEQGVVSKLENEKQITYQANNPIALDKLTEANRQRLIEAETKVKQAMPILLSYFYSFTEKPGVRFYQGVDGIKDIYQDILRNRDTLYLVRGQKHESESVLSKTFLNSFITKRVSLGINVVALTPDTPDSNKDLDQDRAWLMDRTWLPADLYDEPVEIDIFGSKSAFISFGEELFATVIESQQIATALRKLIDVVRQQIK